MNESDLTPHQQAIALIAAAYPVPAWAVPTLRIYAQAVEDLDASALHAAVMTWLRTRNERPTIADLRKAVASGQAESVESPYLEPDEAWAHVVAEITRTGRNRLFPARFPLVAEVVRAMGWVEICDSTNQVADRAHFLQLYRGRLDRARRDDAATPGAQPQAATGDRPSVVHQRPALVAANRADAQALVADLTERLQRPRQLTVVKREDGPAPEPEIADPAEVARREARRRELLGSVAHDAPPTGGRP